MNPRMAWVAVALLGAIGCGQKGPLYLPEHTGAVVTRPGTGAQNTGATPGTQQPANGTASAPATQTSGTATPPAQQPADGAATAPSPAPSGTTKKNSGKDADDSSQK